MSPPNWRQLVLRHASAARVDLPAETIDELAAHLDDLYTAAQRQGASEPEAHDRAMRALEDAAFAALDRHAARASRNPRVRDANDLALITDAFRHQRRSFTVLYALRMALRQFRQHRAFTLTTVLVLGLGTGAAAAVYTIVDAVVLRPLPYHAPDQLVTIWETNASKSLAHERISPVNFMDYRALPAFTDAAAWWRPDVSLTEPGLDPVRVNAVETSPNLFTLLGVQPEVGPGFPADGPFYSRSEPIVVLSDRIWRSRYNADPTIVGKPLQLGATTFIVMGIMPPRFNYPGDVDVWERLRWDLTQHSRAAHFMESVARLQPGVDRSQAVAQLQTLTSRLATQYAATNTGWSTSVVTLQDDQLGYYRPALLVLFGAVGLLLVIACLNVASLLLTRALSREREVAVRTALGASPRQLITQLLAESLMLSIAGAGVGVLAATVALPLIVHATAVPIPRLDEIAVNGRVLGLALGVVVATTMFFGLVPALVLLRRHVSADLRAGERGSSRGARRIYHVLVAGELALACSLLVGSALLVRSVQHMTQAVTGVDADDVMTANIQLSPGAYPKWPQVIDTYSRILEHIRQEPGIEAAGATNFLPVELGWRMPFLIDGVAPPTRPEETVQALNISVSEGYFESVRAKVNAGRSFATTDTVTTPGVVVVNDTFARRFLKDGGVGAKLRLNVKTIGPLGENLLPGQLFEVIGVVADIRDAPISQPIEPAIYFASRQFPFFSMALTVRGRDTATELAAIKAALKDVAPQVPLGLTRTWGDRVRGLTGEPRLLMSVLMFFSGLAALLAAVGVYGLFSWAVAVRRRELAIRLTLGAKPSGIGALVLRQSALLIGIGLGAGWLIVRLSERAIARVLFDVRAGDLASTAAASAILLAAALIACGIPALRAARTDPAASLRD